MIEKLLIWKKTPAFDAGVELYRQLPVKIYPLRMFEPYVGGEVPDAIYSKLRFAIDDYLSKNKASVRAIEQKNSGGSPEYSTLGAFKRPKKLPDEVKSDAVADLRQKVKRLHKEQVYLRNKVIDLSLTAEERLPWIKKLMKVTAHIDNIYRVLATYEETGHLPPAVKVKKPQGTKTIPVAELVRKRDSLKSRISRIRKRPEEKYQKELAQKKQELSMIEQLLGLD